MGENTCFPHAALTESLSCEFNQLQRTNVPRFPNRFRALMAVSAGSGVPSERSPFIPVCGMCAPKHHRELESLKVRKSNRSGTRRFLILRTQLLQRRRFAQSHLQSRDSVSRMSPRERSSREDVRARTVSGELSQGVAHETLRPKVARHHRFS